MAPVGVRLRPNHESFLAEAMDGFADPDPARRRAAILAVAQAGPAVVPLVHERLAEASNPLDVRSALLALGAIGGPAAEAAVLESLAEDGLLEEERAVAALVLGNQPGTDGAAGERRRVLLRGLAMQRRAVPSRSAAVLALGRAGDVEGLQPLVGRLTQEPLADMRVTILLAAGAAGDRVLLPGVLAALADDVPDVRRAAALAAARIGDPAVLPGLLEAAGDEREPSVRAVLALALGTLADPASLAALEQLARNAEPAVRRAALAALAARADGTPILRGALLSPRDLEERVDLVGALAARLHEELRGAVEECLASPRAELRGAAGRTLAAWGGTGSEQAVAAWLAAEHDAHARRAALLAAGILRVPGVQESLGVGGDPERRRLVEEVRRTLAGTRDVRLLQDALREEIAGQGVRLGDRIRAIGQQLVAVALGLDDVLRRLSPDDGDGPRRRFDVRNEAFQRDVALWFADDPYFG